MLTLNLNIFRRLHVLRRQGLNPWRHRGRKEHELPVAGSCFQQYLNVLNKAELHHFVSFVQHDFIDMLKADGLTAQMVQQTSRRADDKLGMTAQLLLLPFNILSAVNYQRGNACGLPDHGSHLCHLYGQFTGRRHDERLRHLSLRFDFFQYGQQESQCFACACLRLHDDIPAGTR